jgi:tRNA threonylcarbamoyladenosine biosynthesis protein TsaE
MADQEHPAAAGFPYRCRAGSADATAALGRRAAGLLQGGEILLLWGPLGAGKTCFVRGLCRGLGIAAEVTSPTFTLAQRYEGRLVLHHLDFFRLGPQDDLGDVGVDAVLEEVADGAAALAVEWPRALLPLLSERLELLVLPGAGPDERIWHLRGVPETPAAWRRLLAEDAPC